MRRGRDACGHGRGGERESPTVWGVVKGRSVVLVTHALMRVVRSPTLPTAAASARLHRMHMECSDFGPG